jgi:hypothetical protein
MAVDYRITPQDRTWFKRCRRQWDFASPNRDDLEPVQPQEASTLASAFTDALAVYYYPGTWDWQHELKQSLVHKAIRRSLGDVPAGDLERATTLVDRYDACATTIDDIAPVKIQHDVTALVRDPADRETGLLTEDRSGVTYACRVDLLAVDAADEYWVVRHQIVDEWQSVDEMLIDEDAIAACWAWEQDYIGMQIAGTIHNEIRLDDSPEPVGAEQTGSVGRVAQHEPSGGGRSIPQHVRTAVGDTRPAGDRVQQRTAGMVRRTRIRRSRDEIAAVGTLMATEALEMTGAPTIYPSPGPHCLACGYRAPCLSLFEGVDPAPLLALHFRRREGRAQDRPRLGQVTWGFGRGAAPPDW